jgi:hypothetical protein
VVSTPREAEQKFFGFPDGTPFFSKNNLLILLIFCSFGAPWELPYSWNRVKP